MKSKKPEKMLFSGHFNYGRQVEKKYAWAFSGRQAKVFMMQQLASDHGVAFGAVVNIFKGEKQNFEICVDPEWKEKKSDLRREGICPTPKQ